MNCVARVLQLLLLACWLGQALAEPSPKDVQAALQLRVAQLQGSAPAAEGRAMPPVAARSLLARLYERRRFEPAWTERGQVESLSALLEHSLDHGLDPQDYHAELVRAALLQPPSNALEAADRELLFTDAVVRLAYHLYFGKANPRELYPGWNFSRLLRERDPVEVLEALLEGGTAARARRGVRAAYGGLPRSHAGLARLSRHRCRWGMAESRHGSRAARRNERPTRAAAARAPDRRR